MKRPTLETSLSNNVFQASQINGKENQSPSLQKAKIAGAHSELDNGFHNFIINSVDKSNKLTRLILLPIYENGERKRDFSGLFIFIVV